MMDRVCILRNVVHRLGPLGTLLQCRREMDRHELGVVFEEWWPMFQKLHAEAIRERELRWKPKRAKSHAKCYGCLTKNAKHDGLCAMCERKRGAA